MHMMKTPSHYVAFKVKSNFYKRHRHGCYFWTVLDRILPIYEYFMEMALPPLYYVPDPCWSLSFFNSSSITTTSTAMMTAATMMT